MFSSKAWTATARSCSAGRPSRRAIEGACHPSARAASGTLFALELGDADEVHDEFFVDRLGRALLHLAHEVLLERHLGQVAPLALAEPAHVAWRGLRPRHKRRAGV